MIKLTPNGRELSATPDDWRKRIIAFAESWGEAAASGVRWNDFSNVPYTSNNEVLGHTPRYYSVKRFVGR